MTKQNKSTRTNGRTTGGRVKDRGAAMITSLIFLTMMSALGVSSSQNNIAQGRMAMNYRYGIEALNNAETGIADALGQINTNDLHVNGYDDELDPNGDGSTADRWSQTYTDAATDITYNVILVDDNDGDGDPTTDSNNIVRLLAQGTSTSGSIRTVEIGIESPLPPTPFTMNTAVLTEGDLEIGGNTDMEGSIQDVHSNADVDITGGSVDSAGLISAVGTVSGVVGSGGGSTSSGAGIVDIPDIIPGDFEAYVDFVFQSNGDIYDGAGNYLGSGASSAWNGWEFAGDRWVAATDNTFVIQGGDLYFKGDHGNVDISKNVGSTKKYPSWEVTILADGYIDVTGTPSIINYKDTSDPEGFQNLLLVAGKDLRIRGNYTQPTLIQGVIAANETIDISGNPDIHGAVIAAGNGDPGDTNFISGNTTITFDGLPTPFTTGGGALVVAPLYWRQLALAEGAGEFVPPVVVTQP